MWWRAAVVVVACVGAFDGMSGCGNLSFGGCSGVPPTIEGATDGPCEEGFERSCIAMDGFRDTTSLAS
jgi:hypothetical protein